MALSQLKRVTNPHNAPVGNAMGHPDAPPSMMKGEYMPPGTSPKVAKYVAKARLIMYAPQAAQALRAAITGSKALAQSAAAFIAGLVQQLTNRMGPLTDQEYQQVVSILAGTIAHLAHDMGDPDAKLPSDATVQITQAVMAMHQAQPGVPPPGPGAAPPPQGAPPPPVGAMSQLGAPA